MILNVVIHGVMHTLIKQGNLFIDTSTGDTYLANGNLIINTVTGDPIVVADAIL